MKWGNKMYKRNKSHAFVCILIVFVLVFSAKAAFAKNIQETDLQVFFDNTMNSKVEKYHIPNATVSVVKDDKIVYKKGFGYADIENNISVDVDSTLFRIGSTSKLITWTAVMQLVEVGKLDLNADINTYLDFEIPARLEKSLGKTATTEPITMAHLMTHTPGFEDYPGTLFRLSEEELLPLNEYIKKYLPARIFPAGEVAAYSNYGTALAGYVVERVSGLPFSEYVEKNIFTPLNMKSSTYRQFATSDLSARIAKPYRFINGSYVEGSFEYILPEPAGSVSTTASDMANFMSAHLSGGAYGEGRILKEETVKEMHKQRFAHAPDLGGMTLGFMEGVFNDKNVLFHSGGTMLYNTCLYLVPEDNTGIFISYSGGNHLLHSEVFQEYMDFYYPINAETKGVPGEGSKERAKKFIGEYQMNRRSITTDEKINSILGGGIITVDVNEDGYLLVTNVGEKNKFIEIEPGVYQNLREGRTQDYFGNFHKIVFKTDPYGRIMLTTDGPLTYSKAPLYSTMGFTVIAVIISILTISVSLVYWIIIKTLGLFRRGKNRNSGLPAIVRWVGICASVAVLILFATMFSSGGVDPVYQLPQEAYIPVEGNLLIGFIPTLMWIFSCLLVFFTVIVWRKGLWGWIARVHYSIFTLAVLGFMWQISYWNIFN